MTSPVNSTGNSHQHQYPADNNNTQQKAQEEMIEQMSQQLQALKEENGQLKERFNTLESTVEDADRRNTERRLASEAIAEGQRSLMEMNQMMARNGDVIMSHHTLRP